MWNAVDLEIGPLRLWPVLAVAGVVLGLILLSPRSASAQTGCTSTLSPGSQMIQLDVQGAQRKALVHVPAGVSPGTQPPLVLALHGAGGTGPKMEHYSGFSRIADSDGFVVAYPSADGAFWNTSATPGKPDDVAFVRELISYLETNACVDPARVFATGVSNGGGMVALLGCKLSGEIAAIAPVAGATDDISNCQPAKPISVLQIHGTADQVVPYFGHTRRRTHDGLPPFVNAWVPRDGCEGPATVKSIAARTTEYRWSECTSGVRVEHIRIKNGKHQWPGATPPDPGPPATICASCTIWSFFSSLRTPVREWSSSGGANLP